MMKKLSSKQFNLQFFLSDRIKVDNLEESATKYGGATKNNKTGETYSNIENSEYISIKKSKNEISIFIPDTVNINNQADEKLISNVLKNVTNKLFTKYGDIKDINEGLGSWYSDEKNQIVYDNLIIVTIEIDNIKYTDIRYFLKLAEYVKQKMNQEAVTITVNESLLLY